MVVLVKPTKKRTKKIREQIENQLTNAFNNINEIKDYHIEQQKT